MFISICLHSVHLFYLSEADLSPGNIIPLLPWKLISDKYAESQLLENKHLFLFKWLILLTCSCHDHVHTQEPLQWAEHVEQRSKKSNHDNGRLEPGLRHGLISSMHSPLPSHRFSAPSSASIPASSMPVLHPSFALYCHTFLISSGEGAGAVVR